MFFLKLLLLSKDKHGSIIKQNCSLNIIKLLPINLFKIVFPGTVILNSLLWLPTIFKINPAIAAKFDLSIAQTQTQNYTKPRKRPSPPPRIPPNKVKPGGGLNLEKKSCGASESLVALVPINNPVLTAEAYPSFLFYIPDIATDIDYGEFSLLSADEKVRLYSSVINLQQTPGIIKINIPPSLQYALEENTFYRWYFKVYCHDTTEDLPTSLDVNGWIKRVSPTTIVKSTLETIADDYWYDAIAEAANNLIATPQSFTAQTRWLELLEKLDLERLANSPIVVRE